MIDRMDIIIEVPQINIFENNKNSVERSTEEALIDIKKAREIQKNRYEKEIGMKNKSSKTNSRADGKTLEKFTELDLESQKILKIAVEKMDISMRGYNRILRVARTIADLEAYEKINKNHLMEAISYRKNLIF
jgi:magnesium chelatase family protein